MSQIYKGEGRRERIFLWPLVLQAKFLKCHRSLKKKERKLNRAVISFNKVAL